MKSSYPDKVIQKVESIEHWVVDHQGSDARASIDAFKKHLGRAMQNLTVDQLHFITGNVRFSEAANLLAQIEQAPFGSQLIDKAVETSFVNQSNFAHVFKERIEVMSRLDLLKTIFAPQRRKAVMEVIRACKKN